MVTVWNQFGSSISCTPITAFAHSETLGSDNNVSCPFSISTSHLFSHDEIVEDVIMLLANETSSSTFTSLLLSGLDTVKSLNESTEVLVELYNIFYTELFSNDTRDSIGVSQLVVLVSGFIEVQCTLSDDSFYILSGILLVGDELVMDSNVDPETLELYITSVDSYISSSIVEVSISDVNKLD